MAGSGHKRNNDAIHEIGKRVRNARVSAGFTLVELAEKLGVTYQQMHKYETGLNRIDVPTLIRVAAETRVDILSMLPVGAPPKPTERMRAAAELLGIFNKLTEPQQSLVMGHARLVKNTLVGLCALFLLSACDDATVASNNLSKAADNFEIQRRIIFYNGITNDYMLEIEGLCSLGTGRETKSVTVTCKVGDGKYKKHYLGLSDNVTFFAEQTEAAAADVYHYRVTFKPSVIVPDIRMP